jgi:hypothetical protein
VLSDAASVGRSSGPSAAVGRPTRILPGPRPGAGRR